VTEQDRVDLAAILAGRARVIGDDVTFVDVVRDVVEMTEKVCDGTVSLDELRAEAAAEAARMTP
jgi:hypothetical protein